jgi:beta-glucosidase/6-phospho-beta-glucosidase/beta-galactosidase
MADAGIDAGDLDRVLERLTFPDSFDWGASTSGYQAEGGFNGKDDPKNNWYWFEQSGKKERTGPGARFLDLHEEDLDRARAIGLTAFRLGTEWARLQPSADPTRVAPPPFSVDAARLYAKVFAACMDRGMFPAVTLFHWTVPLWAGLDLWLDAGRARELFGAYVEFAVTEVNRVLVEEMGKPPVPYYITINEPTGGCFPAYILDVFPRGPRKGVRLALEAYENLLLGHVQAYRTIHRVYREKGWPRPTVTTNVWSAGIHGMDALIQDLLVAPRLGVPEEALFDHLARRRAEFRTRMRAVPPLRRPYAVKRAINGAIDALLTRALGNAPLSRLAREVFLDDPAGKGALDVIGFDFYDPFPGNNFEFGAWPPVRLLVDPWDWNANPKALPAFLESYQALGGGLPLHVLENGIGVRGEGGRGFPRRDGLTRDRALKEFLLEMFRGMGRGADVRFYSYWTLSDNYEWGSFAPRFGLFGVDYTDGARRLPADITGNNAAGLYHWIIRAFREKDKAGLRAAFLATEYPRIAG